MHSFGFLSHPHAAPSVLSYVNKGQRSLTPLDSDLIHTLYDPRLTAGVMPAAASQLACRILAERMKSSGPDIEAVCCDRRDRHWRTKLSPPVALLTGGISP